MTEVVRYRCKDCESEFGPLGFHGYAPETGMGERPVLCLQCGDLLVGRFEDGRCITTCPDCGGILKLLDGKCPACRSERFVFVDLNFPRFERDAVDLTED